jgi:hypothetical protein
MQHEQLVSSEASSRHPCTKKVYSILSHVAFCSKARVVVRNTIIRFEIVEQVQAVEQVVRSAQ